YLDRAAADRSARIEVFAGDTGGLAATGTAGEIAPIRQLMAQGKPNEATAIPPSLTSGVPHSIDVDILSGDVALLAGAPAAALAAYQRAAGVRRNFALIDRIATAHRVLGRDGAAREVMTRYLWQHPRSAVASATLGRMASGRGDWRQARLLLAHAIEMRPGDAALLTDLAQAELALGETRAAEEAARAAYGLHRSNTRVAATLARVLAASKGIDAEERALLAKASRSSPRSES